MRKEMLVKRAKLDNNYKKKYDLWICNELENIIETNNYKIVHAYLPMGKEINISPLLKNLLQKNITIVIPKTLPKYQLENRILTSLTDIEKGVFGTTHPANSKEYKGNFDLIIVPGLAFDNNNYRLGYGGGYYDNFLVHYPFASKIGIFYPEQEVLKVPTEKHDIRLDKILINRFLKRKH
ncbi:MAG: 5-formyltetrahydrofolate cyclo-ligase [Flavobacteriales bacterium]|nr:5-formyltetrahydrofolate cyclo-ligase [Flavobacteriales bacterium]